MSKDDNSKRRGGVTRRAFFKSAGLAAAAHAVTGPLEALAQERAEAEAAAGAAPTFVGPGKVKVGLSVNGAARDIEVEPRRTLLDALHHDLSLTGAKKVCDRGSCGACTVLMDGEPVYSCMVLAIEASGSDVTTVEGLGSPDKPHPVQESFREADALQCGYCTPGFVMSCAWSVARRGSGMTAEQLAEDTCGNLCRCGTYPQILGAGLHAAGVRSDDSDSGGGK